MAYSGKFNPKNPNKYLGDAKNIFWRSLWERRVMTHLDENPNVIGWSSEEIIIPYLSPVDNRWHRYFPDFLVKSKNKQGLIETIIIEVKPSSQATAPKTQKRVTQRYITEVMTYGVNQAKWKAADEYCKDRNWKFVVVTEKELGI
jgi:hypothetical protein